MGSVSAIKLLQVVENVENALGIELIIAAMATDLRGISSSKPLEAAKARLRKEVAPLKEDRVMYKDIENAARMVADGEILAAFLESQAEIV